MRYLVHECPQPIDPRLDKIADLRHLRQLAPVIADCPAEIDAKNIVQQRMPDALAFLIKARMGNHFMPILGILNVAPGARVNVNDPNQRIPCALLVQAAPEINADRLLIQKHACFDMESWMPRVVDPENGFQVPIELRTDAEPIPHPTFAHFGRKDGHLALRLTIAGQSVSIVILEDRLP